MDNLREHLKLKRKHLSRKVSDGMSHSICQRIIRSQWIHEYSNIGIYHPVNGEVNTLQLINFLWSIDQQVFLPIIDRKNLSIELIITAETADKIIMGVMHNKYNVHGVQFHPESIRTPEGMKLLKNFLNHYFDLPNLFLLPEACIIIYLLLNRFLQINF